MGKLSKGKSYEKLIKIFKKKGKQINGEDVFTHLGQHVRVDVVYFNLKKKFQIVLELCTNSKGKHIINLIEMEEIQPDLLEITNIYSIKNVKVLSRMFKREGEEMEIERMVYDINNSLFQFMWERDKKGKIKSGKVLFGENFPCISVLQPLQELVSGN